MRQNQAKVVGAQRLTPPEVAAILGVQPRKILHWIEAGELAAVNVATTKNGRPQWRITTSALEQFEQSRMVTPPEPKPPATRGRSRQQDDAAPNYF